MDNLNPAQKVTFRNLIIFTIVALSIGWIGHGLDIILGNPSQNSIGMFLWIVTPLATCLFIRAFAGGGWKDFGIRFNFSGNILGYSLAILIFPVVTILILIIGKVSGFILFSDFFPVNFEPYLKLFMLGLLPAFVKNVFEESAWRGYLTPKFRSFKLNDYTGHLLVGLIWGLWHIPYYLFFLNRTILRNYTTLSLGAFIPLAVITIMSYSLVFGEIRLLTGSIWPGVLMHMVEDALINPLLLEGFIKFENNIDFVFSPGTSILAIFFFSLAGIILHKSRMTRD